MRLQAARPDNPGKTGSEQQDEPRCPGGNHVSIGSAGGFEATDSGSPVHRCHFSEENGTFVNLARRGIPIKNADLPGKSATESGGCIWICPQVNVHHTAIRCSIPDGGQ